MSYRRLTTYQAVILQARAYRAIRNFMSDVLIKQGLTVTEWLMIGTIIDSGPRGIRITELANILGVELPVITNLANKAEKDGWVTKAVDKNDKRAKRVVSTKLGGEKACDIEGELRAETKSWLSELDPDIANGYLDTVKYLSNIDK